jgi:hypothetical protein
VLNVLRHKSRINFENNLQKLPQTPIEEMVNEGYVFVDPPKRLNFSSSYKETIAFLMQYRLIASKTRKFYSDEEGARFRTYWAFELLEDVEPSAGLALAAEISRWSGARPMRSFDKEWSPTVRDFFHDFGLFDLLEIDPETVPEASGGGPVRKALRFRSGRLTDGEIADKLRVELEDLCGGSIGPSRAIYSALTEAMTNARQHAYPSGHPYWPRPPRKRWWAGGSWSPTEGRVHVLIYDQGVGVPATLPRSKIWSQIRGMITDGTIERKDSGLLAGALKVRRTSTAEPGRGKGFKDMTDWIDSTGKGYFRLLSGAGEVIHYPGGKIEQRSLPAPFLGTLVEWEIAING